MRPLAGWDGRQAREDDRRLADPRPAVGLTGTGAADLFIVVWLVLPRRLAFLPLPRLDMPLA